MLACADWAAADFLARHGHNPGRHCGHDLDICPPTDRSTMTTDPATITTDQLTAALDDWGINPDDVCRLELTADPDGGHLAVTRWRRDAAGEVISAGASYATVTVVVGVVREVGPPPAGIDRLLAEATALPEDLPTRQEHRS